MLGLVVKLKVRLSNDLKSDMYSAMAHMVNVHIRRVDKGADPRTVLRGFFHKERLSIHPAPLTLAGAHSLPGDPEAQLYSPWLGSTAFQEALKPVSTTLLLEVK